MLSIIPQREDKRKLYIWYFSWTLPYVFLPLADFTLYPFPVISHNQEYNHFQWILWVRLVNFWTRRLFWELPKLAVGVRSENGLVWTIPSSFIVAKLMK